MNRKVTLAVGVLAVAVIGATAVTMHLQSQQSEFSYVNESQTPVPEGEEIVMWDASDPGRTYAPENASMEEEVLNSNKIANALGRMQYQYLQERDYEGMYHDKATMRSVARSHSAAMAEHDYVGSENPNGEEFTPDRYSNVQVSCEQVQRIPYTYNVTFTTPEGEPLNNVSSQGVAADIFAEMVEDDNLQEQILQPRSEYDAMGIGTYIDTHKADSGASVATVYLTIDYCGEYRSEEYHG